VVWSERVAVIGDPELLTHHAGWALTTRYTQHVSSLLQEVTATGAHLRLHFGKVRWLSEGQEPRRQGHTEGQPRASTEERPPGDAHPGAE
jgi:hypothetical protein